MNNFVPQDSPPSGSAHCPCHPWAFTQLFRRLCTNKVALGGSPAYVCASVPYSSGTACSLPPIAYSTSAFPVEHSQSLPLSLEFSKWPLSQAASPLSSPGHPTGAPLWDRLRSWLLSEITVIITLFLLLNFGLMEEKD